MLAHGERSTFQGLMAFMTRAARAAESELEAWKDKTQNKKTEVDNNRSEKKYSPLVSHMSENSKLSTSANGQDGNCT